MAVARRYCAVPVRRVCFGFPSPMGLLCTGMPESPPWACVTASLAAREPPPAYAVVRRAARDLLAYAPGRRRADHLDLARPDPDRPPRVRPPAPAPGRPPLLLPRDRDLGRPLG